MPPQNVFSGPRGPIGFACFCVLASGVFGPLSAQELALQRDYPGLGPLVCPDLAEPVHPAPEERAQANQLASDAAQAVILGETLRAGELLLRATQLDPSSFELAYQHARVLEDLELSPEAMNEYCRSVTLEAEDAAIVDAQARLDALYAVMQARIPQPAREAFFSGLRVADAAMYEPAVAAFTDAIDAAPDWSPPIYNRAVILERLGRVTESLADYRRYLELTPNDIDPVVASVTERIGMLEGLVALPTPSPGAALALGIVPGMGHYYSGRGLTGTIVLALAGGSLAAGIFYKEVTVYCLMPTNGGCPPGPDTRETSKRPYLAAGLITAGGIAVVSAIEAFVRARGRRDEVEAARGQPVEARGPRVTGPSLSARRGRADVVLVGLRF
jgi:tetratricopeptide (TPR) repeat protein